MKLLEIFDLSAGYGAIQALHNISLHIDQGEIVTLIGSNGAGKTTTLMSICGDPKPTSGSIMFEGKELTELSTHRIMQRGIAISPEGRRVFSDMTVLENLKMGGYFETKEAIDSGMDHVFVLFPRLHERASQRAGTLSGGEQQMLAIGRALMSRPRLLLLDEPTLGLAPLIIGQIFEIIQEIRASGVTIFLVEQNANKALHISDRGYVLENGRITLSDTGQNLLINDEVKRAYLG